MLNIKDATSDNAEELRAMLRKTMFTIVDAAAKKGDDQLPTIFASTLDSNDHEMTLYILENYGMTHPQFANRTPEQREGMKLFTDGVRRIVQAQKALDELVAQVSREMDANIKRLGLKPTAAIIAEAPSTVQ